jgi:hypothetical protein
MPLTLRRTNDDPPSYRVKYDGVEVGSISKKNHHVEHRDFWAWEIDTMPMMTMEDGRRVARLATSIRRRSYSGKPLKNGEVAYRRGSLRRT